MISLQAMLRSNREYLPLIEQLLNLSAGATHWTIEFTKEITNTIIYLHSWLFNTYWLTTGVNVISEYAKTLVDKGHNLLSDLRMGLMDVDVNTGEYTNFMINAFNGYALIVIGVTGGIILFAWLLKILFNVVSDVDVVTKFCGENIND